MSTTKIEWADVTVNPVIGCTRISAACDNCYAERMACRLSWNPKAPSQYQNVVSLTGRSWNGRVAWVESGYQALLALARRKRPLRVFVGSMTDLFHKEVPDEWLDKIMAALAMAPQHTFLLLTKRPDGMRAYFTRGHSLGLGVNRHLPSSVNYNHPLPNLWLGVTAENQAMAEYRIPILLDTPAARRFVSVEPMLGPVGLRPYLRCQGCGYTERDKREQMDHNLCKNPTSTLDWIICGGETGPGARPMHPDWVRWLRDQCAEAIVPFFFKSWGEWTPIRAAGIYREIRINYADGVAMAKVGKSRAGRLLDGVEHSEFPEVAK